MKNKHKKILKDMAGFINYALETNEVPFLTVLSTIGHDAHGLVNDEVCFSPRSNGYAKTLHEQRAAAA